MLRSIINYLLFIGYILVTLSRLVHALVLGKETNDYNKLFAQILLTHNYEPESILVEFENATLKSTKKMFPSAIQFGNFEL